MAETKKQEFSIVVKRESKALHDTPQGGWTAALKKAAEGDAAPSNQNGNTGLKPHPFRMGALASFKTSNTHHSSCIESKRDATTGLGFKTDTTTEKLDEYATDNHGILPVLNAVCEDYWQLGNGYLEVVRVGTEIKGLHHVPGCDVQLYLEDEETGDYHYRVRGEGIEKVFARFGDKEQLAARTVPDGTRTPEANDEVSELIHFKRVSSLSRWYGVPDWMAAVALVELVIAITQHNYDFFNNRGVPEFILFITGGQVNPKDWEKIEALMKQHVGSGNSHKSMALNLPGDNLTVQVEKLAMETTDEGSFQKMMETLATAIVSAHRVPPLLAGIMIPGKLGASNELPNAMAAFQALVIGQAQRYFTSLLTCTIGKELNIKRDAFEFNTILDEIDLGMMREAAATRTPLGAADPEGGEEAEGQEEETEEEEGGERLTALAASLEKMDPDEKGKLIGSAMSTLLEGLLARGAA